jgi:hypothetical protein
MTQAVTQHLSTKDRHPILDDAGAWSTEITPPAVDIRAYQERIDAIVGLNRDGKSIIRVEWAPRVRHRVFGQELPRYWHTRVKDGEGVLYRCPPRFVFEQRLEREQFVDAWEKTRFGITDPETGKPIDKGDPPEDYYTFAYLVAEHDPTYDESGWPSCCERLYQESRGRCWGYYREPSEEDLQFISQAKRMRDSEKYINPYQQLTTEQLYEIEVAANKAVERAEMERHEEMAERLADFTKRNAWRLSETDPGVLKHGRMHDLSINFNRQEESGLWVPE